MTPTRLGALLVLMDDDVEAVPRRLDLAIAKLEAANDRAGDALAELAARQGPHIPREGRRLFHDAMDDAGPSFTWHRFKCPARPHARRGASLRPAPGQAVVRRRP